MAEEQLQTQCCIVGGGPAGMMAGFLLARAGVDVIVLEKHGDFLRDFRGDTVHPSTLELMYELGILDEFLKRSHQEVKQVGAQIGDQYIPFADFTHVPTHCKFIALMPQWDFLQFIAEYAKRYSNFRLMMQSDVTDLLIENGRVAGVIATTPNGSLKVRADLSIGADGRSSIVREQAGFKILDIGAPMDVLWMRVSRKESDPPQTLGRVDIGHVFIMLNRGNYWQCGFVIAKGEIDDLKAKGIESFRQNIVEIAPFLNDRIGELKDWNDIKLLTVKVDRLEKWYRQGLLCIGDASHAMSPVGGVGINLAIQDAVAAANILADSLLRGNCDLENLSAVQERREFPTHATQKLQVLIQNKVISKVLKSRQKLSVPWILKLFHSLPILRRIPAYVIGIGFRPEHVKTVARSAR